MFRIVPVMQHGNNFAGSLIYSNTNIGGVGRDNSGIYVNLNRQLKVEEMIELLEIVGNISPIILTEKIKFQYTEDYKEEIKCTI